MKPILHDQLVKRFLESVFKKQVKGIYLVSDDVSVRDLLAKTSEILPETYYYTADSGADILSPLGEILLENPSEKTLHVRFPRYRKLVEAWLAKKPIPVMEPIPIDLNEYHRKRFFLSLAREIASLTNNRILVIERAQDLSQMAMEILSLLEEPDFGWNGFIILSAPMQIFFPHSKSHGKSLVKTFDKINRLSYIERRKEPNQLFFTVHSMNLMSERERKEAFLLFAYEDIVSNTRALYRDPQLLEWTKLRLDQKVICIESALYAGELDEALNWIMPLYTECKASDRALIYFLGGKIEIAYKRFSRAFWLLDKALYYAESDSDMAFYIRYYLYRTEYRYRRSPEKRLKRCSEELIVEARNRKNPEFLLSILTVPYFLDPEEDQLKIEEYLDESIQKSRALDNRLILSDALHYKAIHLTERKGNFQGVEKLLRESLQERQTIPSLFSLVYIHNGLGYYLLKERQFEEAFQCFFHAMDLLRKRQDFNEVLLTLFNVCLLFLFTRNYQDCLLAGEGLIRLTEILGIGEIQYHPWKEIYSLMILAALGCDQSEKAGEFGSYLGESVPDSDYDEEILIELASLKLEAYLDESLERNYRKKLQSLKESNACSTALKEWVAEELMVDQKASVPVYGDSAECWMSWLIPAAEKEMRLQQANQKKTDLEIIRSFQQALEGCDKVEEVQDLTLEMISRTFSYDFCAWVRVSDEYCEILTERVVLPGRSTIDIAGLGSFLIDGKDLWELQEILDEDDSAPFSLLMIYRLGEDGEKIVCGNFTESRLEFSARSEEGLGIISGIASSAVLRIRQREILADQNRRLEQQVETISGETEQNRHLLSDVLSAINEVIIAVDADMKINLCNTWAEALGTEKNSSHLMGKKVDEGFPFLGPFRKQIEEAVNKHGNAEFLNQSLPLAGNRVYNLYLTPLNPDPQSGMVIRLEDVTVLHRKEAQLVQAQKMEVIGNLAGGIAHDFNNVVGGILGTVSLMRLRFEEEGEFSRTEFNDYLDLLDESASHATSLVEQLLSLSSNRPLQQKEMDLNEPVRRVVKLCESFFDRSVHIYPVLFSGRASVWGDLNQLEQVILNICVNASHAMTVMRASEEKQGGLLSIIVARKGEEWNLSIADTGVGMSLSTIEKIFSPFYTKKEKGQGSGLGLSMVENIISRHGGRIEVESRIGEGSRFDIYLPIYPSDKRSNQEKEEKGTILIVDDDRVIRILAASILRKAGYTAVEAATGKEAVERFREGAFAAVLLDLQLPDMNGVEVLRQIRKEDSEAVVLLSSGYLQDPLIKKAREDRVNGFLGKPYTFQQLVDALDNALHPD